MQTEEVVIVGTMRGRPSALAERIAAGKADPISDEERQIVAGLRADYEKKYGRTPTSTTKKWPRTKRTRTSRPQA